jgi:predicted N-formylglutamate amidohydrolase
MGDAETSADGGAVHVIAGQSISQLLLLCDHASNAVPIAYGTLGLPAAELERHIAYDIGAADVVVALAATLNAPAFLTRASRLLIDCNRATDDPTLIMRLSDGAIVPGNRVLDDAERQHRIVSYHRPYHHAIASHLDRVIGNGLPPVLVSIHSFTPTWKGWPRPWHVGVLWDKDDRLAKRLLSGFSADPSLIVGDNQPYSGRLYGDCLWQHGTSRGLAHAIIEIRQDLIAGAAGQNEWAARIAAILIAMLDDPIAKANLTTIQPFGSHT